MNNISVVPFYKSGLNGKFFNRNTTYNFPSRIKDFFQNKGCAINTVDLMPIKDSDYIVFFDLEFTSLIQAWYYGKLSKSIYIPFEPPVVQALHSPENLKKISMIFSKVLTWQDDLIKEKKFIKFHFPMPVQTTEVDIVSFGDKKFLTTIVSYKQSNYLNELYSKRIEAIRYFEQQLPEDFDLYGMGWDGNVYSSYRGAVDDKLGTLSRYKFTLCYENQADINGLISEKIFDCFYARTIPIFWGAANVEKYIPSSCYIDKRKFDSYYDLQLYIESMTAVEYQARIIAIEKYLNSNAFELYSSENFVQSIHQASHILDEKDSPRFKTIPYILWLIVKKMKYKFSEKFFLELYKLKFRNDVR